MVFPHFSFSRDGKLLVVPEKWPDPITDEMETDAPWPQGTVKIIEVRSGRVIQTLKGDGDLNTDARISHSGSMVITGSYAGTVQIWDVRTGKSERVLRAIEAGGHLTAAISLDDSKAISTGRGRLKVWDIGTGNLIWEAEVNGNEVKLFPDNLRILSLEGEAARIFALKDGTLLTEFTAAFIDLPAELSNNGPLFTFPKSGFPGNETKHVWRRRRPEWWWGVAWLPEFWLTLAFGLGLVWSVWRDWRGLHSAPEPQVKPATETRSG